MSADYDNPWMWRGEPFTDPSGWYGMVYLIVDRGRGMQYIGRKFFRRRVKRPGKRARSADSDWRTYYGSSDVLKEEVKRRGTGDFERYVLSLHKTRGSVNYHEMKELFTRNVLADNRYYNETIGQYRRVKTEGDEFSDVEGLCSNF